MTDKGATEKSDLWATIGLILMCLGSFSTHVAIGDSYGFPIQGSFLSLGGACIISVQGTNAHKSVGVILSIVQGLVFFEADFTDFDLYFGVYGATAFIQISLLMWDWQSRKRSSWITILTLLITLSAHIAYDITEQLSLMVSGLMLGGVFLVFFQWNTRRALLVLIATLLIICAYFDFELRYRPSDVATFKLTLSHYSADIAGLIAVGSCLLIAKHSARDVGQRASHYLIVFIALLIGADLGWIGDQLDHGLRAIQGTIEDGFYRIQDAIEYGWTSPASGSEIINLTNQNGPLPPEDEIIVTGSRIAMSLFGGTYYLVLFAASFALGALKPTHWRKAGLAIALLSVIGAITRMIDHQNYWEEFFLRIEPDALIAPFVFTYFGSWYFRNRERYTNANQTEQEALIEAEPFLAPKKRLLAVSRLIPMKARAFFDTAKAIRLNPNEARRAVQDPQFSPLRFKLSEAFYAGRLAALIGIIISTIYAALLIAYGKYVDLGTTVIGDLMSDYLQSLILAAIVPLAFLFSAYANSLLLTPKGMRNKAGRKTVRDLYLTFDGSYGYRAQQIAGISFVCTAKFIGMLDFNEGDWADIEPYHYELPFAWLGLIVLIISQVAQYVSLFMLLAANFFKIPVSVSRTLVRKSAIRRSFLLLGHGVVSIVFNLIFGLFILTVTLGLPILIGWLIDFLR